MTTEKIKTQEIGVVGKINIPKDIESMIDFLHKSIGATEWSGILFYKFIGGDMNKLSALEFKCEFLYPMNIGNSTYTEFDYNSEVMNAYDVKDDLIECATGMLHTHHNMSAFFSGTDTDELLANCKNFNYYISLIVNFNKEYKCKIAFPSKSKNTSEYQIRNSEGELITAIRTVEEDNVIIGELLIEFENTITTPEWLDKRVKELKVKKATPPVVKTTTNMPVNNGRTYQALQAPKSYNDYDFEETYPYAYKQTFNKPLPTPKEFLSALISVDPEGSSFGLEGAIMGIELAFEQKEVDYDAYDNYMGQDIEEIHDKIYGDSRMFKTHCKNALNVLENNEQLFSDQTVYQIVKENLELYAI